MRTYGTSEVSAEVGQPRLYGMVVVGGGADSVATIQSGEAVGGGGL
jgi:hypothetical protein